MRKIVKHSIFLIFEIIFIWTLFLIFGMQSIMNVYTSKQFPIDAAGFLIIGGCAFLVIYKIYILFGDRLESFLKKRGSFFLVVSLIVLLFWQLYSCYGGYFQASGDAEVIRNNALYEARQEYDFLSHEYFSWWYNNILIIWVFSKVINIAQSVGIQNWEYALVAFQCVIVVLSVFLVYRVVFGFTHSHRMAWLAYAIAYFFIGISPWPIIPYSDSTGLIFPILIIRLYQILKEKENKALKMFICFLMGLTTAFGFHLKPQIIISFISIVIMEAVTLVNHKLKERFKSYLAFVLCCIVGILTFWGSFTYIIKPSLHFQLNDETQMGWQHYFMMGLNKERDGINAISDNAFSQSYLTNDERNQANLKEAKRRLKDLGVGGLIQHICRKQLVNYGDGTFAWTVDGRPFIDQEWANNGISDFVRSFIKQDGSNYNLYISLKQLIWIMVLFFQVFVILFRRNNTIEHEKEHVLLVLMLSVIGLTFFNLIFEARARYIYCYAPIFVVLCVLGMKNTCQLLYNHGILSGKKSQIWKRERISSNSE